MLLTVSTTHRPATDLGYLLHKNPGRSHEAAFGFGRATVFYPEANEDRCTIALVLEVDPVGMVRGRSGPSGEGGRFDQYVNDRPYVASSYLSTAIAEFFSTAMGGRSKERPELAATPIPLEVRLPVVPVQGDAGLLERLFTPLGYEVEAARLPLDDRFPEWGESPYFAVTLRGTVRLADLLNHLYVLVPVLDDEKHYWIGSDEIEKLLRRGGDWVANHPARDEIARRYLRHDRHLTREALARLSEAEGDPDPDAREEAAAAQEEAVERPLSLHEQRLSAVTEVLRASGAQRVVDLGCGEGRLIRELLKAPQFSEIVGVDVSVRELEKAHRRLRVDRMPPMQAARLKLLHGSLVYRDRRLDGYDAAAVVEVIEHLDLPRLTAFERVVFEFARPQTVVITTPNQEYNALFPTLPEGAMRHRDHRFEWTRTEFVAWTTRVAEGHGYAVAIKPLGPEDPERGAPSQMAVFTRMNETAPEVAA